ncbi:uncharacterized protein KY384_002918 [Bacidia gigantensis]|uniref:uncharacterized protein n=1 Tax=Bacidia gigantensis TaxID=2732470 RepID=UPI001D03D7B7|nr:uncharacterized protein KY384_002918 [Bacidia gigantensis]KAG8531290.1 hypothetical protein KY384_002918 [Bacidia gigantensis]
MTIPKPPYPVHVAQLGGVPNKSLDIPLCSVFMVLFLVGGAGHMTRLQLNLRRGHKFPLSGAMFGFSMARVVACIMRIIWAVYPTNVGISIAAVLFVNLGDLLCCLINILLAQSIVKALHPRVGNHKYFRYFITTSLSLLLVSLCIILGFVVSSYYTLDRKKLNDAKAGSFAGGTYNAFTSLIPIFLILISYHIPRKETRNFGKGSMSTKVLILLYGSLALATGFWFRVGSGYMAPRPVNEPPPWFSKACFYIFYFTIEVSIIWGYLIMRIDLRFYMPAGPDRGDGSRSMPSDHETEEIELMANKGKFTQDSRPTTRGTGELRSATVGESDGGDKVPEMPHLDPTELDAIKKDDRVSQEQTKDNAGTSPLSNGDVVEKHDVSSSEPKSKDDP